MLVGNKCDESAALREVTELEGKAEASTWGVSFMETSAKNNINVTELFQVNPILINVAMFKFIFYIRFDMRENTSEA